MFNKTLGKYKYNSGIIFCGYLCVSSCVKKDDSIEIRAKKHFGQNFLKDRAILQKIIESIPNNDLPIVEIGPGLGDLTAQLINVKDVIAFEIDKELCQVLAKTFDSAIAQGRLTLICADVLERWHRTRLIDEAYNLIANLPYYVATRIILNAYRDPNCKNLVVMVQKEVAEKFTARSGMRDFCALSVLSETVGEAELLFDVPPTAFEPEPKVTSSVMLVKKQACLDDERFESFLRSVFAQPRKTLAKNLQSIFGKENVNVAFLELKLPPSLRPHEASTSIYHRLYTILAKKGGNDEYKQH